MAKVIPKDKESLQAAKRIARGVFSFREMKDGRKIAAKWPNRRKN